MYERKRVLVEGHFQKRTGSKQTTFRPLGLKTWCELDLCFPVTAKANSGKETPEKIYALII
jgi:hypothetical protein